MESFGDDTGGNGGVGVVWTSAMLEFVMIELSKLVASGAKTSSGFKQVHLNNYAKALNDHLKVNVTGGQISNHLRKWKRIWKRIDKLQQLSAALWDEKTCTIRLELDHYNKHIKVQTMNKFNSTRITE